MSRPAPTAARVRAQATFDTLTFLRNGEQTLVSIVLPALALVGGVLAHRAFLRPGLIHIPGERDRNLCNTRVRRHIDRTRHQE